MNALTRALDNEHKINVPLHCEKRKRRFKFLWAPRYRYRGMMIARRNI